MWKKIKPYLLSVLVALGVGGLAAYLTRGSMNLYDTIKTPPLSPPAWLFPVVWTILYILMGISAAAVYRTVEKNKSTEKKEESATALAVYGLSLALNFLWSILFFNGRLFLLSFGVIAVLFATIAMTVRRYRKILRWAGNLQIPYLLWVAFASYLNLAIYLLNR